MVMRAVNLKVYLNVTELQNSSNWQLVAKVHGFYVLLKLPFIIAWMIWQNNFSPFHFVSKCKPVAHQTARQVNDKKKMKTKN